jgi:hypothetical protein
MKLRVLMSTQIFWTEVYRFLFYLLMRQYSEEKWSSIIFWLNLKQYPVIYLLPCRLKVTYVLRANPSLSSVVLGCSMCHIKPFINNYILHY